MKRWLSGSVSTAIFSGRQILGENPSRTRGLRILTYHRVTDIAGDRLSVHPRMFDSQMEWLYENGFVGVRLEEALEYMSFPPRRPALGKTARKRESMTLDPRVDGDDSKHVAITIDDGYDDNFREAFPILKKYGFSATIYLISDFVGTNRKIPRYANQRERVFLTWEEVLEMSRQGIEFGSHTATHPRLTLVSREDAEQELVDSKAEIELRIGKPCDSFCYPGGMWNKQIEELVRNAGYRNAATVMPGTSSSPDELFRLKRTEISGEDTLFDFEKKMAGAFDWLHGAWQKLGLLK